MKKTAYLFPGQGAQRVGMARDLYETFPQARRRLDAADRLLGLPLTRRMFGTGEAATDEAALRQTDVTQPALYAHSLAAVAVLQARGQAPDMVAGHSLGGYRAVAAAGAVTFAEGLRLVRLRGQLMAAAGERRPGTMAAVIGKDDAEVEALCAEATEAGEGLVQPANFNAPGQVVVSGDEGGARRLMARGAEQGARVLPLPVSGAFHSPLMAYAREGLAEALGQLALRPPRCPVYLNVTAAPTTDPATIRSGLLEQLAAPVRWAQTLRAMQADGAGRFVEVGAGKVLSGLVRRTLGRDVQTVQAGTAEQIEALSSSGF